MYCELHFPAWGKIHETFQIFFWNREEGYLLPILIIVLTIPCPGYVRQGLGFPKQEVFSCVHKLNPLEVIRGDIAQVVTFGDECIDTTPLGRWCWQEEMKACFYAFRDIHVNKNMGFVVQVWAVVEVDHNVRDEK